MAAQATIYIDSNVFIYAVEGTGETAAPAKKLLAHIRDRRPGHAVTSELTIAEVLSPSKRADALPLSIKKRLYLDLLIWSGVIRLVPVTRSILIETADLRAANNIKLPDAIHIVTAIHQRCRFIVSADVQFRRLPAGMRRVAPDEAGIESLLKEIT